MLLSKGSTGPSVTELQINLIKLGFGLTADGDFGDLTEMAVRAYQNSKGLVVDGEVGNITQASIVADVNPVKVADQVLLKGVDVYRLDGVQDWDKVKAAGYAWAYMQATQGTNTPDSKYAIWKHQAAQAGLIVGPYHFIRFDQDMNAQIKLFTDRILQVGLDKTDLPPCLDFEYYPESRTPQTSDVNIARFCLEWIAEKTGRLPVIYLSSSLPEEIGMSIYFAKYPLWAANYNATFTTPSPWANWSFHQYSDKGQVPGIHNADGTDVNYFNGSIEDLKKFISNS